MFGRYVHRVEDAFDAPHTLIANVHNFAQLGVHPARPRPRESGEDPFVVWGTPDVVRDFLYVRDVVDGALLVLEKGESMKPYNIGAGSPVTVGDIVNAVLKATGKNPKVEYDETKPTTIIDLHTREIIRP